MYPWSRWRLPLYGWRLLAMAAIWNVVILSDRYVFGFQVAGYPSYILCGLYAVIFLTAPLGVKPGKWLVRDPSFAHRWRWVFWWLAVVLAVAFLRGSYLSIWGNGPSRAGTQGEGIALCQAAQLRRQLQGPTHQSWAANSPDYSQAVVERRGALIP